MTAENPVSTRVAELASGPGGSGLSFSLNYEERRLCEEVERFARRVVAPGAADRDSGGGFDHALWQAIAEFGLLGICIPREYGGSGANILSTCLALEAFQRGGGDSGVSLAVAAHLALGAAPIWLHGTDAQKEHYLPKLCSGEWIGGLAATEPEAGSDVAAIKTTAAPSGENLVVNGAKTWITNGSVADVLNVLVRTNTEGGDFGFGISCLLVEPKKTPGVFVEGDLDTSGYRSSVVSNIRFEGAVVPVTNVLGRAGVGLWQVAFECFDWERTVMIAPVLGEMERSLGACVDHSRTRRVHGQPLGQFQLIQDKLARMKTNLETSRWATYRAAWLKDNGMPHKVEAPLAKYAVANAAMENAVEAMQILGGTGYLRNSPVERTLRDAKLAAIAGGTSELQKMAIANSMLEEAARRQASEGGEDTVPPPTLLSNRTAGGDGQ